MKLHDVIKIMYVIYYYDTFLFLLGIHCFVLYKFYIISLDNHGKASSQYDFPIPRYFKIQFSPISVTGLPVVCSVRESSFRSILFFVEGGFLITLLCAKNSRLSCVRTLLFFATRVVWR